MFSNELFYRNGIQDIINLYNEAKKIDTIFSNDLTLDIDSKIFDDFKIKYNEIIEVIGIKDLFDFSIDIFKNIIKNRVSHLELKKQISQKMIEYFNIQNTDFYILLKLLYISIIYDTRIDDDDDESSIDDSNNDMYKKMVYLNECNKEIIEYIDNLVENPLYKKPFYRYTPEQPNIYIDDINVILISSKIDTILDQWKEYLILVNDYTDEKKEIIDLINTIKPLIQKLND